MSTVDLFLYEEDHRELQAIVQRLCRESEAKAVFLIDKNGQQLSAAGDYAGIDTVSLATLAAGNVAATDGLAKLLGEAGFTILFHEGERDNIHISVIGDKSILVVIFDERTTVGLVRLRVKKITDELLAILEKAMARHLEKKAGAPSARDPDFPRFTDKEIEDLFK